MSCEENKKKGFIKLHRSLLDWEWYEDANVMRLFLHFLLKANIEDKKWQGVEIKRGSFITSLENLSTETNMTIMQIRTALNKLKITHEITHKTTRHYSMITINNYNLYQDNNTQDNISITSKYHPDNIPITTTKEIKNIRNTNNSFIMQKNETEKKEKENKIFKKPSIEEIKNYISEKSLRNVDAETFFYYYETNGWKTGRNPMKSWQSALNFWNRNALKGQKEEESWSDYVDRMFGESKK